MPWPGGGLSRSVPGWAASLASRSLTSSALILSLVLGLTSSLGGISASHQTSPWPSPEAGVRGQLAQSGAGRTDSEAGGQYDPGQQPLSEPLLRPLQDEASDSAASRSARSPSNHSLHHSSHSLTQCLPSLQSDSAAVTAGHICRCADTWTRVWLTLHNPNPVFTSQCWDRTPSHRDYCLPPVLTPSELANIESPEAIVCEAQVESLLSRVRAHTSLMEESIKVLQSAGSSTHCHNASHCQACAVSHQTLRQTIWNENENLSWKWWFLSIQINTEISAAASLNFLTAFPILFSSRLVKFQGCHSLSNSLYLRAGIWLGRVSSPGLCIMAAVAWCSPRAPTRAAWCRPPAPSSPSTRTPAWPRGTPPLFVKVNSNLVGLAVNCINSWRVGCSRLGFSEKGK